MVVNAVFNVGADDVFVNVDGGNAEGDGLVCELPLGIDSARDVAPVALSMEAGTFLESVEAGAIFSEGVSVRPKPPKMLSVIRGRRLSVRVRHDSRR